MEHSTARITHPNDHITPNTINIQSNSIIEVTSRELLSQLQPDEAPFHSLMVSHDYPHHNTPLNDHAELTFTSYFNVPTNSPQTSRTCDEASIVSSAHLSSREVFITQRSMLVALGILDPFDGFWYSWPYGTVQDIPTRPVEEPHFERKTRFVILRQPDALQRRSYAKEKRYICPKPVIVCARETVEDTSWEDLPRIVSGTVSVELALYEDNTDKNNPRKLFYLPHLLECTDGKTKSLVDKTTRFELTVSGNSGLDKFLLVFSVTYHTESGVFEEFLLSSPFSVVANSSKNKVAGERVPAVQGLQPTEGPANSETEVWIKGSEFSFPVEVTFAESLAKIVSVEDNLLTVLAPRFPHLKQDTPVLVSVANVYPDHTLAAPTTPLFTYYVSDRHSRLRNVASQNEEKILNEIWHSQVS